VLIIDASVAVKFLTLEEGTAEAAVLLSRDVERHAPDWMVLEVASSLWGKVKQGMLLNADAMTCLEMLPNFFDAFHPTAPLIDESFQLSLTLKHPVYDCLYLYLAIRERAILITADKGLIKSARRAGFGDFVELLTWPEQTK
jgi:predicted nucleic acid-binding protein